MRPFQEGSVLLAGVRMLRSIRVVVTTATYRLAWLDSRQHAGDTRGRPEPRVYRPHGSMATTRPSQPDRTPRPRDRDRDVTPSDQCGGSSLLGLHIKQDARAT
jgi:hypothetical protein